MKLKKVILKGKRIVLKPYTVKDAKEFSMLGFSNWRIGKINSTDKSAKWIKNSWKGNSFYLGIFLKQDNKLIGNIELCHMDWWADKAGEICILISKAYQRKGYGTEAAKALMNYCFRKLKFHKMYADTTPDNKAGQKSLEKLGFKLEGRIRRRSLIRGKWTDELDYGLLKKEWRN